MKLMRKGMHQQECMNLELFPFRDANIGSKDGDHTVCFVVPNCLRDCLLHFELGPLSTAHNTITEKKDRVSFHRIFIEPSVTALLDRNFDENTIKFGHRGKKIVVQRKKGMKTLLRWHGPCRPSTQIRSTLCQSL